MFAATFSFILLKCLFCVSVKRNLLDFLRSGRIGWQSLARFSMILLMLCTDTRKDLKRFNVDVGDIAIAAVLFSSGDVQVWVKL